VIVWFGRWGFPLCLLMCMFTLGYSWAQSHPRDFDRVCDNVVHGIDKFRAKTLGRMEQKFK
jgi:hypothetical protein